MYDRAFELWWQRNYGRLGEPTKEIAHHAWEAATHSGAEFNIKPGQERCQNCTKAMPAFSLNCPHCDAYHPGNR